MRREKLTPFQYHLLTNFGNTSSSREKEKPRQLKKRKKFENLPVQNVYVLTAKPNNFQGLVSFKIHTSQKITLENHNITHLSASFSIVFTTVFKTDLGDFASGKISRFFTRKSKAFDVASSIPSFILPPSPTTEMK